MANHSSNDAKGQEDPERGTIVTGEETEPRRIPLPSTEPSTNLLIADIVLRGASNLFRRSVEQRIARASTDDEAGAQELVDGRAMLTSLALYGASKLATRSVPGLLLVSGGLVAKTLYDRGKARQQRLRDDSLVEGSVQRDRKS